MSFQLEHAEHAPNLSLNIRFDEGVLLVYIKGMYVSRRSV